MPPPADAPASLHRVAHVLARALLVLAQALVVLDAELGAVPEVRGTGGRGARLPALRVVY